mgnify:CR=1 FL=1
MSRLDDLKKCIKALEKEGRPLANTEWLHRILDNTIFDQLPLYHEKKIGSIHWGLVAGHGQFYLPWEWLKNERPDLDYSLWQHDLFYEDYTPYNDKEIELFEKALSQYDEKNIGNLNNFTKLSDQLKSHGWDISSTSTEQLYNDLLKLFPKEGKSAGLEKGWFNSDKNKDGFKDYDIDRYHKLLHEIYKTNQDGLPQSVVEELKRKSTLKNAAGVSST